MCNMYHVCKVHPLVTLEKLQILSMKKSDQAYTLFSVRNKVCACKSISTNRFCACSADLRMNPPITVFSFLFYKLSCYQLNTMLFMSQENAIPI